MLGMKQLSQVMILWDIGKQCIPNLEAPLCGVS